MSSMQVSSRVASASSVGTAASSDRSSTIPSAGRVAARGQTASSSGSSSAASRAGGQMPPVVSQQQLLEFGEEKEFLEFPKFTEAEIRSALEAEAKKHPTWNTSAVKKMKLVDINTSVAFRYTLETFTETRSTYETCEQYSGTDLGTTRGSSPSVWDIQCQPRQPFAEETRTQELPGSAYVTKCETCNGQDGHCYQCRGTGTVKCTLCNETGMRSGVPHPLVGPGVSRGMKSNTGSGRNHIGVGHPLDFDNDALRGVSSVGLTAAHLCDKCGGRGIRQCSNCGGLGKHTCVTCNGHGRMKKFITLKIRFENDKVEYIHEAGLSDDIFKRVRGEVIMTETRKHVYPMKNFPIEAINEQSRRLVQCHLSKHQGSAKILQQRHILEAIPVACVSYDLNGVKGSCWVLGLERMAHVPQYPKKCCIL